MEFKLILKKLNNTLSEEEATIFSEWYNESELHKSYFMKVQENYHNETLLIDIEKGWKAVKQKTKPTVVKKTNYLKYAVAASIVLFISIIFINKIGKLGKGVNPITTIDNIEIGTEKATLTLQDGTEVLLEKGKPYIADNLENDGDDLVYKESNKLKKEIVYNYLTVPRGGQYHVVLSDGTQVWLNSESKIKYPVNFIKGSIREVELVYGEMFFDVTPSDQNKGAKFKVNHKKQEVVVLGTEFNIKAYKDETEILTTLVEGSVSISNSIHKKMLRPGQQSKLSEVTNDFDIYSIGVEDEISWRNGIFSFANKPLQDITKVLSRWYDVDIIIANKKLKNIEFTGVLSKNQSIIEILEIIKSTNNMNYTFANKKLKIE